MADIRTLTVEGTTYNIKDATARADIIPLQTNVTTLQTNVTTLQTNVTQLQENTADLPQIRENVENNSDDIRDLKSAFDKVTETSKNLFPTQSKTTIVNGVTFVYEDGSLTLSGTATQNGGRLTPITDVFVLPAGTYTVSRSPQNMQFFLESGGSVITQINADTLSKTFTIENETRCFIGVNVVNETTYNVMFTMQLEPGSNATEWKKPSFFTAVDLFARAEIAKLQALILENVGG